MLRSITTRNDAKFNEICQMLAKCQAILEKRLPVFWQSLKVISHVSQMSNVECGQKTPLTLSKVPSAPI